MKAKNLEAGLCAQCGQLPRIFKYCYCRPCKQAMHRAYAVKNKEKLRERGKLYRQNNAAKLVIKNTAWNKAHPDLSRKYARTSAWRKLGILNIDGTFFSPLDYDRHYQIQQGCCLACGVHQSALKRALVVDHNHKTGFFRGLLCDLCNKALGQAKDDPSLLRKLAVYLETV